MNKKIFLLLLLITNFAQSNTDSIKIIDHLENKYENKISEVLKNIYPDDLFEVKIIINPDNAIIDINKRETYSINASVLIDGNWNINYDENGKAILNKDGTRNRTFQLKNPEDIKKIENFIKNLINYDMKKNDKVLVQSIQFDRIDQFKAEDIKWRRKMQLTAVLFSGLVSLVLLILVSLIYRFITKEIERRLKIQKEKSKKN